MCESVHLLICLKCNLKEELDRIQYTCGRKNWDVHLKKKNRCESVCVWCNLSDCVCDMQGLPWKKWPMVKCEASSGYCISIKRLLFEEIPLCIYFFKPGVVFCGLSTTENLQIKEKYKLEMGFLHCGICKSIF